jgi:predicted Zn-dependent protease
MERVRFRERTMTMRIHTHRLTTLALAVVFALWAPLSVLGPVTPAHAQLFGISEQQEIQIGRQVEAQFAQKPGFVNDPAETQHITDIGLRLAHVSERPNLPWTYHIINDSSVNSIAAPGGFIFVTAGMLRFVQNVNELAFVLGHETTHVAHRHAVQLAQRDMELQFGALLVSQILFGGSMTAYQLSQLGRSLMDAKYSRDKEAEADRYGVIYARKAGYDPTAALTFMERLQAQEKSQPALLHAFEDHPDTPARVAALRAELRQMGYQVAGPVPPPPSVSSVPARQPVRPAPVPPYTAPSFSTDNR